MLPGATSVSVSRSLRIGLASLISALCCLIGCSKVEKPVAEAPPPPLTVQTAQANQPQRVSKVPPPQLTEVQQAVNRVFKEAAVIDTSHQPTFIVGDFNGDRSQDLAVVLKPASDKLSELNEEFPNWILRDLEGPTQSRSPRLRVGAKDKLLAIIHGYEAEGWRNDQATQTYLLKNAARPGMEVYSAKDFMATHRGRNLPQMRGDVLGEDAEGKSGCLYYANATYSWYDPKTFDADTERRVVHMAPASTKK